MKLFGSDTNSGMIQKISDWFGMNFNPKLLPRYRIHFNDSIPKDILIVKISFEMATIGKMKSYSKFAPGKVGGRGHENMGQ